MFAPALIELGAVALLLAGIEALLTADSPISFIWQIRWSRG